MRAHYLQHVSFEGLGHIETWLIKNGLEISCTQLFDASQNLPNIADLDLLIILGGPMSVNELDTYPWLTREITFIQAAIAAKIPTLGICLGAQLIAKSLSSTIYANPEKEIGWFPIQSVIRNHTQPRGNNHNHFQFSNNLTVLHWHGETFDLPQNTIHLARTAICKNQAFQFEKSVIGIQFHLEMTPDAVQQIVTHCGQEIVPAPYIQAANTILKIPKKTYYATNQELERLLTFLTKPQL